MKNKNRNRGTLLFFSVLFLLLIFFIIKDHSFREIIKVPEEEMAGEDVSFKEAEKLQPEMEAEISGENFPFRAWHNEEDENYYFFLPGYMKDKNEWELSFSQETMETRQNNYLDIELSDIPVVYIEVETGSFDAVKESKENKGKISFSIFTENEGVAQSRLKGMIKARGNASFNAPRYKKSYTIKLDENTGFLDMKKGSEWVLLAHYYDDTHLRDFLTFDMAERLEMAYVPKGRLVNLFVDGEFEGIYFLCEKPGISPEKINITNLEELMEETIPESALKKYPYTRSGIRGGQKVAVEKGYVAHEGRLDITGGYLLELEWLKDRYNEEKSGFTSNANQCVVIKSPEYATGSQVSYIKNYYQQFEEALRRSIQENSQEYLDYIDLDSFVKKYLVEEVSKNMDANMSSQYLYKDIDSIDAKFYAGPVWDYDRAYDNKVGDVNNRGAAMFWVNQGSAGFDFWKKLYETEVFRNRVRELYEEKLSLALREYVDEKLWEWGEEIHDSVIADMFRYQSEYEEKMDEEARLSQEMKALSEFIKERKAFLDGEWITN